MGMADLHHIPQLESSLEHTSLERNDWQNHWYYLEYISGWAHTVEFCMYQVSEDVTPVKRLKMKIDSWNCVIKEEGQIPEAERNINTHKRNLTEKA